MEKNSAEKKSGAKSHHEVSLEARQKIVNFGVDIRGQIRERMSPKIRLPVRTLSNTYFDDKARLLKIGKGTSSRAYLNTAHTRKFMQTMLVAAQVKKVIDEKAIVSIRDLYYALKHTVTGTNENTFEEQEESDPIIEDLEVTLDILREQMNLEAARRGYMVGNVTIKDSDDIINCRKLGSGGWGVPSRIEDDTISFEEVEADYVLVVEKDAVFSRLNQDKYWKTNNCILVTGQGMAPRGVRRLVHRLNKEHGLDVIIFTDADAAGYYIYSVYKQGSINLAFQSDLLGTPNAKFVGLTTMDVPKFDLPQNVTIKMNEWDKKRAKELMAYPWMQKKEWVAEIKNMLAVGYKLEQEALTSKGIRFVTNEYLPYKFERKEFLP